jgi:2-C-methyl-D-erythritol 4-phosphate cytidylyltransferase
MSKPRTVIIVAGGKGLRMNADIPKQFIAVSGKPVLMHTIEVFRRFDAAMSIIVVLPREQFSFWDELCRRYNFAVSYKLAEGGESRFYSVKNGLELVSEVSLVAVHDGVRPLVSAEAIERCFAAAEKSGAAIPVVDMVESIRQLTGNGSVAVDRAAYRVVQTPQVFDAPLLREAYDQEFSALFTDDASVVEAFGAKIQLVEGNRENIKITTAMDLKIAEALLPEF